MTTQTVSEAIDNLKEEALEYTIRRAVELARDLDITHHELKRMIDAEHSKPRKPQEGITDEQ